MRKEDVEVGLSNLSEKRHALILESGSSLGFSLIVLALPPGSRATTARSPSLLRRFDFTRPMSSVRRSGLIEPRQPARRDMRP
jgi:hypothetical protein